MPRRQRQRRRCESRWLETLHKFHEPTLTRSTSTFGMNSPCASLPSNLCSTRDRRVRAVPKPAAVLGLDTGLGGRRGTARAETRAHRRPVVVSTSISFSPTYEHQPRLARSATPPATRRRVPRHQSPAATDTGPSRGHTAPDRPPDRSYGQPVDLCYIRRDELAAMRAIQLPTPRSPMAIPREQSDESTTDSRPPARAAPAPARATPRLDRKTTRRLRGSSSCSPRGSIRTR